MANIKEGKTFEQISELLKIHWKTIQSWLRSFRKHGINGLFVKATKDKPKKLSKEAEEWIRSFLTSLSNSYTGRYITGKQLTPTK